MWKHRMIRHKLQRLRLPFLTFRSVSNDFVLSCLRHSASFRKKRTGLKFRLSKFASNSTSICYRLVFHQNQSGSFRRNRGAPFSSASRCASAVALRRRIHRSPPALSRVEESHTPQCPSWLTNTLLLQTYLAVEHKYRLPIYGGVLQTGDYESRAHTAHRCARNSFLRMAITDPVEPALGILPTNNLVSVPIYDLWCWW